MPRSLTSLFIFGLISATSGCGPSPQLTAAQEQLVRHCLTLAFKEEPSADCNEQISKPMEKAFLQKHPDFYDELIAERKAFVEERLVIDQRRADELNRCLDGHERGNTRPHTCEQFMPHEITRGLRDRRLRRCATASLQSAPEATKLCAGLPEGAIEAEIQIQRDRRTHDEE